MVVGIRRSKANEWTFSRKLAGNVLPVLHWLPTFFLAGILLTLFEGSVIATALILLGVFVSLTFGTWKMFDRFGMFQNAEMRRALHSRLGALRDPPPADRSFFVGLATHGHISLLDTDEDIGYLTLYHDRVTYLGDQLSFTIPRENVLGVERRAIPIYSLTGHYWTVIRYRDLEKGTETSIRVLSREADRVFTQQPKANRALWESVKAWYNETATAIALAGGVDAMSQAHAEALRELNTWLEPAVPAAPEPAIATQEFASPPATSDPTLEIPPPPEPLLTVLPDTGPAILAQRAKELLLDGAPWTQVQPCLVGLVRCFERPEVFRDNHELLMGVYLALRLSGNERAQAVATMPAEDALAQDSELAEEYRAAFGEEAPTGAVAGGATWLALRGARRMQALFARRALRELAAEGSA